MNSGLSDRGGDVNRETSVICSESVAETQCDYSLAMRFKALGHPARLEILRKLSLCDSVCCGDLVGCMVRAQSTISQHLQVLKEAGLVDCHVDGRKSCYRLNRANFEKMQELSNALFESFAGPGLANFAASEADKEDVQSRKKEIL